VRYLHYNIPIIDEFPQDRWVIGKILSQGLMSKEELNATMRCNTTPALRYKHKTKFKRSAMPLKFNNMDILRKIGKELVDEL
jgi:hypothetical protein